MKYKNISDRTIIIANKVLKSGDVIETKQPIRNINLKLIKETKNVNKNK